METWQEVLRKNSIASLEALSAKFGAENFPELDRLRQAAENFEFRISPAMVDLIKSPNDPIWRQYVPSVEELDVVDGIVDSLNEDGDSPVPNITHRYPDRALFLVSPVCATYCRFCTRRRKVGDPEKIPMSQFESAFQYLEQHTEIRDVIMSGGDPLLLNDRRLDAILTRLRSIRHIQIVRIGSRIPCHLPERITPELCATLRKFHPLFINTHFNHPDELTPAAVKALGMLADAGIPLGCQTVLLKGVNDTPAVMMELMQAKKAPTWMENLQGAREIGNVHIAACSMTMELFGLTLADLEPMVDEVTGVASFIEKAQGSKTTLFI